MANVSPKPLNKNKLLITHCSLSIEMTYQEAIEELETILRALETDSVDVDDLTTRVERSAELIRLCRRKLRHAEASLDRVFDTLDDEDETDGPEEEDANEETDTEDEDEHDRLAGGAGRAW